MPDTTLSQPRIIDGPGMQIAGLGERFGFSDMSGLPALWQRFGAYIGKIPGEVGGVTYGVCSNPDDNGQFDYVAGVEVADPAVVPIEFVRLHLAAQHYAVFAHQGHVAGVRATFAAIFNEWMPRSGYRAANAAPFERYDQRFDPKTGMGGFEIWIPVVPFTGARAGQ